MTTLLMNPLQPKTIPINRGLPLLGNLLPLSSDILGFVVRSLLDYPEIVQVKLAGADFYLVNHPDLVEEVLATKNRAFIKDKGLKEFARPVFGNGLLSSDGDFWLRQRRLAQPAFHRQRIAAYGETMIAFTERAMTGWRDGEVRDLHEEMMHLTLEVVAKTLFDKEATAELGELAEINAIGAALDTIMARFDNNGLITLLENALNRPLPTPLHFRTQTAVQRLGAIVDGVIAERRTTGVDKGDLLGMFLAACDEAGNGMSDQQLRDECKTMFLAGHETTALTLSWTWWQLLRHPEVKTNLQAEVATVLGGRLPTLADLPQLRYTEQVIQESMRLMPPAWMIQREALTDVEIGGYMLPQGAQVGLSQYAIHRDPRWYPEPERFHPERWADDLLKRIPKYAYFPFGGGPRLCIGQQFAMMEAVLMLAAMAQRFDFDLLPNQRIVPQPSITMRPKYGLKVRVRAR